MEARIEAHFELKRATLTRTRVVYPALRKSFVATRGSGPQMTVAETGSDARGMPTERAEGYPTVVFGSFPWSAGVQALSIALLQVALNGDGLSGRAPSAATTLDYALTKAPSWVEAIFGVSARKHSYAQHLFRRSNSNSKRDEPVEVRFAAEVRSLIFIDDEPATRAQLQQIHQVLLLSWSAQGTRRSVKRRQGPEAAVTARGFPLENVVESEVFRSLHSTPSDRAGLRARISALQANPSFLRIAGRPMQIVHENELSLPNGALLGMGHDRWLRKQFERVGPVKVAVAPNSVGALAMFVFLQESRRFPIEIDFHFLHALDIARRILSQDPYVDHDLCVIAHAPAASLLQAHERHDYKSIMLLPNVSQRVVASREALKRSRPGAARHYSLLCDDPSTASFYFDSLERHGQINSSRVKMTHHEPFESAHLLQSQGNDHRAVLFFPFYRMNEVLNDCALVDDANLPEQNPDTLLFARPHIGSDIPMLSALSIALRDAWFTLRDDPERLRATVRSFAGSAEYRKVLSRASGLSLPMGL